MNDRGNSASIRHESAFLDISRASAVDVLWRVSAGTNAGLSEESSECMVGGRGEREGGRGVVEPFSMEKPFSAVWEVKLVGFFCFVFLSTRVRGQLLSMTSIQERGQLKNQIQRPQRR